MAKSIITCNCGVSNLQETIFESLDIEFILHRLSENMCRMVPFGEIKFISKCGFQYEHTKNNNYFEYQVEHDVVTKTGIIGKFIFYRKSKFSKDEEEALKKLSNIFRTPIKNAMVYNQAVLNATIDSLSNLKNRRCFDLELDEIIGISFRNESPVSILMIDIDHFKKVNDTYGHIHGDLVIKEIAKSLRDNLRVGDRIYRYGGEEFIAILPETSVVPTFILGKRLVSEINKIEIPYHKTTHKISISVGGTTVNESRKSVNIKDFSKEKFIEKADQALYEAKETGRNKFIAHQYNDAQKLKAVK